MVLSQYLTTCFIKFVTQWELGKPLAKFEGDCMSRLGSLYKDFLHKSQMIQNFVWHDNYYFIFSENVALLSIY